MNARGEQGVAFGGWSFSKATGRTLAHVPELHPPPSSFPWGTGDEWRAPELLPWSCGAEGALGGDCFPTGSSSEARQHFPAPPAAMAWVHGT